MKSPESSAAEAAGAAVPLPAAPRELARRELGTLLRLALPIIITQLSQMGMGVADAIMAGQVSPADLAGIALGGNFFWPAMLFFSGVLISVTPSVSHLHGARREGEAGEVVRQAFYLVLAGGACLWALMHFAGDILRAFGVDPAAIPIAEDYLRALRWGVFPILGYFALRYLCEGMSWTTPAMVIGVGALLLKIPLNYLFIYGGFGIEPKGGAGCGWASGIVMNGEFLAMLAIVAFSRIKRAGLFARFSKPDPKMLLRLTRLGAPIGAAIFAEIAVFSGVTLLIGRLGVNAVAAHQIVANVGGLTFMIPLALGMAATIRVGYNVGAGDLPTARLSGLVAMGASLVFAVAATFIVFVLRVPIASLYTNDPAVLALAAELLIFVAAYQAVDELQVTAIGTLRGYKDTRTPMIATLIAYWLITLPLGVMLAFGTGFPAIGVHGFWVAMTVGLALVAVLMTWRALRLSRDVGQISRLARLT